MHIVLHRFNGRGRALRGGLFAAAMVAAAALLGLVAISGVQAAPSLSASENPVVIPNSQSTKTISLSWNLSGATKATLTVQENGGPSVLSETITTQTGSEPLTVTFGESYTATLKNAATGATMATMAITTKRPGSSLPGPVGTAPPLGTVTPPLRTVTPPLATVTPTVYVVSTPKPTPTPMPKPTGCALDCIKSVTVEQWGGQIHVEIDTTVPVSAAFWSFCRVEYWSKCSPPHPIDVHWSTKAQHFEGTYEVGGPGVVYDWTLDVTDAQDKTKSESGSFTVLRRQVTVTFEGIFLDEDSDPAGTGECYFDFWVNEQMIGGGYRNLDCDSGHQYGFVVATTVHDAPGWIDLKVFGADDDSGWPFGLLPCNVAGEDITCEESAWGAKSYDVRGAPATKSFIVTAYEGNGFAYSVDGHYSWTYVP